MSDFQMQIEQRIIKELGIVAKLEAEKAVFGPIKLNKPEESRFGDYTTNMTMQFFSSLSKEKQATLKNPRDWAGELKKGIEKNGKLNDIVKQIEVAGGGFINFYLTDQVKIDILIDFLKFGYRFPEEKGKTYLVEFSSPNIAKPFTVGHLRSTIIGAAIANLLQATGKKVIRDNHLGDWGTQFGKQVVAIEKWGNWEEIEKSATPVRILVDLYVQFHDEADKDPTLEDEAREVFTKMEQGNKEYLSMWQKIVDLSMKEFDQIYKELGVFFDENEGKGFGESAVINQMSEVIDELEEKNLLVNSRAAEIVEFPKETKLPPLMILKKDGSTLYATRDLATDKRRLEHYGPDLTIINEVGKEQSLYFQQLFKLEEMLGWFKPGQRVHVAHGLYRFQDRKMSTRKGDVIWLADIKQAAVERIKATSKSQLSQEDIDKIAWGAIKWNDLSREAINDIDFDLETMLSLKGNSGSYMQYTAVRIQSIWQKSANGNQTKSLKELIDQSKIANDFEQVLPELKLEEAELNLVSQLNGAKKALERAAGELAPQILANYLFELAQKFNNYYAGHEILGNETRLLLTKAIGLVLVSGFEILMIEIPSKM